MAVFSLFAVLSIAVNLTPFFAGRAAALQEALGERANRVAQLVVTLVMVGGYVLMGDSLPLRSQPMEFDSDVVPVDAIRFMRDNGCAGKRIMNAFNHGGAILRLGEGTLGTFVDGRQSTAFPEEVLKDYLRFSRIKRGWKQVLDKYAIEAVFFDTDSEISVLLEEDPDWEVAYKDARAMVFVRAEHP